MIRTTLSGQRLLFESDAEARFLEFHENNPAVYAMLRDMALALRRAGHKRWGIRCIWERMRYEFAIQTTETAPRLNDHMTSFYARKLMAEVPELAGMFELRERH